MKAFAYSSFSATTDPILLRQNYRRFSWHTHHFWTCYPPPSLCALHQYEPARLCVRWSFFIRVALFAQMRNQRTSSYSVLEHEELSVGSLSWTAVRLRGGRGATGGLGVELGRERILEGKTSRAASRSNGEAPPFRWPKSSSGVGSQEGDRSCSSCLYSWMDSFSDHSWHSRDMSSWRSPTCWVKGQREVWDTFKTPLGQLLADRLFVRRTFVSEQQYTKQWDGGGTFTSLDPHFPEINLPVPINAQQASEQVPI